MKYIQLYLGVLFSLAYGTTALYSAGSPIVDLTPDNFHKKVISGDEVWVVEFYAPWCGHCRSLVPEYEKVAKALKGVVKVGAINADEHKGLAGQYSVKGFPTIKIFGFDKFKPDDFNGQRTAEPIIDAALKAVKSKVSSQLSGKKGKSESGSGGGSTDDVVELTDSNFDKLVLQSDDLWLVEFFAPWCGHCKNLAPHWQKAATELKGKVKLGALDSTVHTVKASQYDVRGYPTIKFFHKGEVEEYSGGRTSSDIVQWANDKLSINISPPEVVEITSNKILESTCKDHPICVIAILPNILDCQSKCRNEYLSILQQLGDKFKQKLWGWGWSEAMAQPDLEESFELGGFGYPALAALNAKKMQFASFKGSFSIQGIHEFLRDISFGRGGTAPLKGAQLPKILPNDPWDGEDGTLPVEEDLYLDDIVIDDLEKDEL